MPSPECEEVLCLAFKTYFLLSVKTAADVQLLYMSTMIVFAAWSSFKRSAFHYSIAFIPPRSKSRAFMSSPLGLLSSKFVDNIIS
jgi:hypothetical protein